MNKNMYIFISALTLQSLLFGMDTSNETCHTLFHTARGNFNLALSCRENADYIASQKDNLDEDLIRASLAYYAKTARAAAKDSRKVVDRAIAHHSEVSTARPHSKDAKDALRTSIDAKYYVHHTHRQAKKIYEMLQ